VIEIELPQAQWMKAVRAPASLAPPAPAALIETAHLPLLHSGPARALHFRLRNRETMATSQAHYKDRQFLADIGDEVRANAPDDILLPPALQLTEGC
jgi:hypothetical protein